MNIQQIINKYVEEYEGCSYSYIANKLLDEEELGVIPKLGLSHRTLRSRVSEADKELKSNPKPKFILFEGSNNRPNIQKVNKLNCYCGCGTPDGKCMEDVGRCPESNYPGVDAQPFVPDNRLQPYLDGDPNNILIIGDTHLPFERKGYLEHCRQVQERFNCGRVLHIGDEVDNHAISYHESDANGYGPHGEFMRAMEKLKEWYRVFPNVDVIVGNHSALPFRKANSAGLTKKFLKTYEDIWEAPVGWKWHMNLEINNVYYTHNASSKPINMAVNRRQSTVGGHFHTSSGIEWNVNKYDRIFGMNVGCGIDDNSYAFSYAKDNVKKSIISCAVVLNDLPIIIPMQL